MTGETSTAADTAGRRWRAGGRIVLGRPGSGPATGGDDPVAARFGVVADAHCADRETAGTRHYRDALRKLTDCVAFFNAMDVDFVVEMGDLKDQGPEPDERETLGFLEAAEGILRGYRGPLYHVAGNHDFDSITKEQFLARIRNTGIAPDRLHYAFDAGGIRFIVLDPNFRADADDSGYARGDFEWTEAYIPPAQRAWLEAELDATERPVVIFAHQHLQGEGDFCVNNAACVRELLGRARGGVLAVFQAHNHEGGYKQTGGIHYFTFEGLIERAAAESTFCYVVAVHASGEIAVVPHYLE